MRARVIEEKCCGFATCLSVAPDVFDIDNDQIAVVQIDDDIPVELQESVRDAASACPTDAIAIDD